MSARKNNYRRLASRIDRGLLKPAELVKKAHEGHGGGMSAEEAYESWINGNRTTVIEYLTSQPGEIDTYLAVAKQIITSGDEAGIDAFLKLMHSKAIGR